jgi:hypothetical protein
MGTDLQDQIERVNTSWDSLLRSVWTRGALLVLSLLCLIFIFSSHPFAESTSKPAQSSVVTANTSTSTSTDSLIPAKELLEKEVQKANDEIKMLEEQIDTWYHYKFILIGGLVAIFMGQTGVLAGWRTKEPVISEDDIGALFKSSRAALVLGLACVIALAVDMHIRNDFFGMQQLGYWLSTRVEPKGGNVQFWETFLRGEGKQTMQNSLAFQMLYGAQLHFFTIFIYLLFSSVFQSVSVFVQDHRQLKIALAGFLMVHFTVLTFIVLAHTVPSMYTVTWFPGESDCSFCSVNGSYAAFPYLVAWLVLFLLNLPFLIHTLPVHKAGRSA